MINLRSCRAIHYNAHLLVQFCQEQHREGTIFSLGRMGLCLDSTDAFSSCHIQCLYCHNSIYQSGGGTFWHVDQCSIHSEAIKGLVSEFQIAKGENVTEEKYQFQWLYRNG